MAKRRVKWYGKRIENNVYNATEDALERTAINIVNEAKLLIKAPKSGKFYPGAKRRSAAPGEPPAVQTGHLRSRVQHEKPRPLVRRIGTNVKYGLWQELGTSQMSAHPFLRPAFERRKRDFLNYIRGKLK